MFRRMFWIEWHVIWNVSTWAWPWYPSKNLNFSGGSIQPTMTSQTNLLTRTTGVLLWNLNVTLWHVPIFRHRQSVPYCLNCDLSHILQNVHPQTSWMCLYIQVDRITPITKIASDINQAINAVQNRVNISAEFYIASGIPQITHSVGWFMS